MLVEATSELTFLQARATSAVSTIHVVEINGALYSDDGCFSRHAILGNTGRLRRQVQDTLHFGRSNGESETIERLSV